MTFFIGTDEAGYGPNLGPLLISATAWRFPESTSAPQCWELLSGAVRNTASDDEDKLYIADSKQVFSSGRSIEPLERTVLSLLRQVSQAPSTFRELGTAVAGTKFQAAVDRETCMASTPVRLPLETDPEVLERSAQCLSDTLQSADVELADVRARVIFPAEFNQLLAAEGSKGRVLSAATLNMVADILRDEQSENAYVICDKHGGRICYGELLSAAFDDHLVFCVEERRRLSRYRLNQVEFRFQAQAEEHLPVAAASMVSKYVREVAMLEFNAYWREFLPELKPTKGYPVDAARFLREIESELDRKLIPREQVWRIR